MLVAPLARVFLALEVGACANQPCYGRPQNRPDRLPGFSAHCRAVRRLLTPDLWPERRSPRCGTALPAKIFAGTRANPLCPTFAPRLRTPDDSRAIRVTSSLDEHHQQKWNIRIRFAGKCGRPESSDSETCCGGHVRAFGELHSIYIGNFLHGKSLTELNRFGQTFP